MIGKAFKLIFQSLWGIVCAFVILFGFFGIISGDFIGFLFGLFVVGVGISGIMMVLKKNKDSFSSEASKSSLNAYCGAFTSSAVPIEEALHVRDYVVVDVETTGLSSETDEIIEVAAIRCINGVFHTFYSLVRPYHEIPERITELTGISNAEVRRAPRINAVIPRFVDFIKGLPLVAHNAPFDVGFLTNAMQKSKIYIDLRYIDTLELSRIAFPSMHNHKLSTLIRVLHLADGAQKHRAGSDTEATHKLFLLCQKEIPLRQEREEKKKEKVAAHDDKAYHLNQCGLYEEASGNIDKAISYYEDIVSSKAVMPNAYMRLAVLYKKRHQWSDVVRVCDAALSVLPGTAGRLCQPEEYEQRKAYALAKLGIDPDDRR